MDGQVQHHVLLPQLVEVYLHGDLANGWRGKFAKHTPDPCGHSEAINVRCALKLLVDTVIELPTDDGRATRRGDRVASRHLADLHANQLRPSDLRNVQQRLIDLGRARSYINGCLRRMLKFFGWCVKYEHMEPSVLCGLQTIDPLGEGEDGVREPAAIVSPELRVLEDSLACAGWLLRQAMIVQALCSMRPGELVQMRVCDLRMGKKDDKGVVWEYRPQRHKTQNKGVRRIIQVNADAQAALRLVVDYMYGQEALLPGLNGPQGVPKLGDPSDTRRIWWRAVGPTGRAEGWRSARSYGKAVQRASERAGVKMMPNQLRKYGITLAAQRADVATAQQAGGHTTDKTTTQHYIRPDVVDAINTAKARQYALDFGVHSDPAAGLFDVP